MRCQELMSTCGPFNLPSRAVKGQTQKGFGKETTKLSVSQSVANLIKMLRS